MSYFDENGDQVENNSALQPEAEAPTESVENITQEEKQELPTEDAPTVSEPCTPEDNGSPSDAEFTAQPAAKEDKPTERSAKKRVATVILCSLLAVVLIASSFFGGAMFSRYMDSLMPPVGGEQENPPAGGGGNGGSFDPTPGIDRGDVVLNVVESVAGLAQAGSVPAVVEAVEKAVVEIRTETAVNDPFNGNYVQSGAGSGVIISADGLVLTCHHVIDGAETVTVTLSDGTEYVAEVYGTDSWSDLALLKLEGSGFSYATLAKAPAGEKPYSYMKVGETAIAIGNPLGELGGSVSVGVISALGREVTVDGMPMTLLQIDASVNPGNSGGGLFNLRGELIGIVNAKSTGDAVEGIGFAIPSTYALDIVSELYKQGYVSGRPYLGMYFQSTSYGLQIVSYEFNDALADGKKVEKGDYLQSIDGKEISKMSDIRTILADKKPGDTLVMKVSRLVGAFGYQSRYETIELTLTVYEYIPK